jgi:hypothetical protein
MKMQTLSLEKGPKSIYDLTTLNGIIDVEQRKSSTRFTDNLDEFIENYKDIHSQILTQCKDIQGKSHALGDDLFKVSL